MSGTTIGHSTGETGHGSPHRLDTIVRYTANDRTNHWLTAIAFVLAALSGLFVSYISVGTDL